MSVVVAAALVLSPALLLPSNSPQRLPPPTMVAAAGSDPAALPPPLAASDGVHTFTYDSVQRRLPLIVEAVVANNPSYNAALQAELRALADEIRAGAPLRALREPSAAGWIAELAPHLDAGATWFTAPWFLVENYLYKRVLELTDAPSGGADPFAAQKAESLAGSADAFGKMAPALAEASELAPLVMTSLWGNLADLSLSAGAALVAPADASAGGAGGASMLLADDTAALCGALEAAAGKPVTVVLDNCGLELVSDLLLVDGLLRRGAAGPSRVTLHAKDAPVFVSDVCAHDLELTLAWFEEPAQQPAGAPLAARLRAALADGRLKVECWPFYTGSLAFWEMPVPLRAFYRDQALVITKGDANSRRLLGDRHWAHDTDFAELMGYWPCALAALRTCKSGVLVGTAPDAEAAAAAAHPDKWLTAGLYGMVQFRP